MKNIKTLLSLILLAIISFSCVKEESNQDDKLTFENVEKLFEMKQSFST